MKPLERIFFKACLMKGEKSVRDIVHIFSDLGFLRKSCGDILKSGTTSGFMITGSQ